MSQLISNYTLVLDRIKAAALKRPQNLHHFTPNLVAVSKLKPTSDIIELYKNGHRHFGENYINELEKKANSQEILLKCPQIKWHFVGNLQTNKVNKITNIPNLHMIETVDSVQIAEKLNNSLNKKSPNKKLNILMQVNTSGEEQKHGIEPVRLVEAFEHILKNHGNLQLAGLMTIGSLESSLTHDAVNKDFQVLIELKNQLVEKLKLNQKNLQLSMGMSNDFEQAILMGSTSVRLGTLIFGQRTKINKN